MKEGTRVIVSLVAAMAIGSAVALSGNATALRAADAVAPLGTLWVNAIRMTVIPLIVSLIITGVASAADVSAVGRLGVRTLGVFISLLVGAALLVVPASIALFSMIPGGARPELPPGASEAARDLMAADAPVQTFGTWLGSLLPSNPIAAAANGAMVPFILFVLLLGIAIARSSEGTRLMLVGFFRALGEAMMTLVNGVIWFTPLGVFALVLPLAAHAGAALVGGIGFYIIAYSLASLLFIVLLYPVVGVVTGTAIKRFAAAALPAQLIALSTSSSVASLPAIVRATEDDLKLPTDVTSFVVPIATAMFKFAAPVSWTIGTMFVGWFYNVPLHAPQLLTVALAAVFLGFASPGIPRGAFIMLAPLLTAVGLPVEGVGLLIAVDAIPDTFATSLNVTGTMAATVIIAGRGKVATSDAE